MKQKKRSKKLMIFIIIILIICLCISVGFNIYKAFFSFASYLQNPFEIYTMESGILYNNLEFAVGNNYDLQYDFNHQDYKILKEKYNLEDIAQDGTELEKALRLMNEFASRLTHKSDYDNSVNMKALDLLEYSLDNKNHGINCRNKAQILNEMLLSLGIYSRKVWIMPYSKYDNDCHVVNEIYDTTLNKWIMLDITNNEYWVDEKGNPLSILEIREKLALQEFCTPIGVNEKTDNLKKVKEKHIGSFLYIAKNSFHMEYCTKYSVGETDSFYMLYPKNNSLEENLIISKNSIESSPIK